MIGHVPANNDAAAVFVTKWCDRCKGNETFRSSKAPDDQCLALNDSLLCMSGGNQETRWTVDQNGLPYCPFFELVGMQQPMGDHVLWVRLGAADEGKDEKNEGLPPFAEVLGITEDAVYFDSKEFFWDDNARAHHLQQETAACLETPDGRIYAPVSWLLRHSQQGENSKRALMHWAMTVRDLMNERRNEHGN